MTEPRTRAAKAPAGDLWSTVKARLPRQIMLALILTAVSIGLAVLIGH
jgi:hypothetical protein